ncbi:hypothetical protein OBP_093 [Pseudomonas phage OBP]|uniref:hypothetical protein n=1 Tax=Pseudomonas phage OBP TaxID=1124849 RepID=UPI000240D43B|nr:hypothetical protein OBP_093 [Pseudomonas phage OBP]AEV89530.1 hypothetical protein OBP_093 [Pseudomonas phage OBP]
MSEVNNDTPQTEMQQEVNKEKCIKILRATLLGTADDLQPSLPLFIGTLKEEHAIIYRAATSYLGMVDAQKKGNERAVNIFKSQFEEIRAEHFPGSEDAVLFPMLTNYFHFFFNGLDRTLVRDETIDLAQTADVGNTFPGKAGPMALVNPLTPSVNATMGVRERMRRNFLRAYDRPDSFNLVLENSLIFMKVKVPEPLELVRLINDIVIKLRQYGEKYQVSSLHLERAGIGKILVNFILDRLSYHSVKGIDDPYELKSIILANDLNQIAQTLLCITQPKGVAFRMYCLANKCNYSENVIIDPTSMLLELGNTMPEKRWELLQDVVNNGRKLSREEIAANPPVYLDKEGKEIKPGVDLKDGTGRLLIGVPTMGEYFAAFDAMAERLNPELRQLAVDFPNQKIYSEKRKEVVAALRGGEYLQWFRAYEIFPPVGEEGDNEIITREEDPKEFDEGLMDIFNKDDDLYYDAIQQIITYAPRMTYTFVGIKDDVCPNCKKKAEGVDREATPGFTPVDPVLNFFDHTRMMINVQTFNGTLQEDSLS